LTAQHYLPLLFPKLTLIATKLKTDMLVNMKGNQFEKLNARGRRGRNRMVVGPFFS
jgi:hypothetical protein